MKKAFVFLIAAIFFVILLGVLPYLAVQKLGTGHRLSPLSENYYSDSQGIYFLPKDNSLVRNKKYLSDVDARSFTVLNEKFAKDKSHVYHRYSKLEGADPETFTFFDGIFPMDAEHVYECVSWKDEITSIDPKTIRKINDKYVADKDSVYRFHPEDYAREKSTDYEVYISTVCAIDSPLVFVCEDYFINGKNLLDANGKIVLEETEISSIEKIDKFWISPVYLVNDSIYICYGRQVTKEEYESYKQEYARPDYVAIFYKILFALGGCGVIFFLILFIIQKRKRSNSTRKEKKTLRDVVESFSLEGARTMILLPSLFWPMIAFMTLFLYDNPQNMFLTNTIALSFLIYPLYLMTIVTVGEYVFKKTGNLLRAHLANAIGLGLFFFYYAVMFWIAFEGW